MSSRTAAALTSHFTVQWSMRPLATPASGQVSYWWTFKQSNTCKTNSSLCRNKTIRFKTKLDLRLDRFDPQTTALPFKVRNILPYRDFHSQSLVTCYRNSELYYCLHY